MPTHPLQLVTCEEAFALVPIPVWITDVESLGVLWANEAALEFWQAASMEELAARDMRDKIPESVSVRVRQTVRRILAGEVLKEEWTFYPKGTPTPLHLHLRAITLPDGRLAMLNQALKLDNDVSPSLARTLDMLRLSLATLAFVDAGGTIHDQNIASREEFGSTKSWIDWIHDPTVARQILDGALAGKVMEVEASVRTARGERIHAIHAHKLRDPVSGDDCVLVQHFDVTERVRVERLVQTHVSTLKEQNLSGITIKRSLADGLATWRSSEHNQFKKMIRT
jgi:diguanylate cyclase